MTPLRRDLLLFFGALLVRALHLSQVRSGPLFRYLLIDSAFYDAVGKSLARGDGFPDGVFFMNVLYGAFLGAVYSVAGAGDGGRLAALVLQALMGALSCVLTARIGDALGRSREGLWAAVALSVYGPAIFYDGALLTPSLFLLLTTAAVLATVRAAGRGAMRAALPGALTGILILGRANHVLLALAFGVLLLARGGGRAALVFFAVCAGIVLPATVRNWSESGELVWVSANGGMALWAGNHDGATGIYSQPGFLSEPVPETEAEDYRAEASRRAGQELTLAQSSRYWVGETLRAWAQDPARAVRLAGRKLRYWLSATESQTNLSYYFAMEHSWVLRVFRLHLGWVLPLALLGIPAVRSVPVAAIPIGVSLLTCLAFYVSSEYRHPVVPCLLLLAADGASRAGRAFSGAAAPARRAAMAALLASLIVLVNFRDPLLARLQSRRVDWYNFGRLALAAGNPEEAERFLLRSIRVDSAWPPSRRALAEALHALGRPSEAGKEAALYEELLGLVPGDRQGVLEEATRLFRNGDFATARSLFLSSTARDSTARAGALNNAALCSMNLGEADLADSLFREASRWDSLYASPVIHRGRLALARGDSASAVALARRSLEIAPSDGRARRLLARSVGRNTPP